MLKKCNFFLYYVYFSTYIFFSINFAKCEV